jgi:hypothetical protein
MAGIKQSAPQSVQSLEKGRRRFAVKRKRRCFFDRKGKGIERGAAGFSQAPLKPPSRRLPNTKEQHMSKPSHIAYIVNETTKNGEKQSYWRAVGAVWPHKNGEGFDVVIHDRISVTGRITCIVPKADEADDAATE